MNTDQQLEAQLRKENLKGYYRGRRAMRDRTVEHLEDCLNDIEDYHAYSSEQLLTEIMDSIKEWS